MLSLFSRVILLGSVTLFSTGFAQPQTREYQNWQKAIIMSVASPSASKSFVQSVAGGKKGLIARTCSLLVSGLYFSEYLLTTQDLSAPARIEIAYSFKDPEHYNKAKDYLIEVLGLSKEFILDPAQNMIRRTLGEDVAYETSRISTKLENTPTPALVDSKGRVVDNDMEQLLLAAQQQVHSIQDKAEFARQVKLVFELPLNLQPSELNFAGVTLPAVVNIYNSRNTLANFFPNLKI